MALSNHSPDESDWVRTKLVDNSIYLKDKFNSIYSKCSWNDLERCYFFIRVERFESIF